MTSHIKPETPPAVVDRRARRRDVAATLVVFVTALAIRLFFLSGMDAYPRFELIKNRLDDQVVFDLWAKSIVRGEAFDHGASGHEYAYWAGLSPGVPAQAPLYPHLLAGLYAALGSRPDSVRLIQMLLGALTAVLVYAIARHFLSVSAALACGLAAACYGPFVFYAATFLRAAVLPFVCALSLLLLSRIARERPSGMLCVATGLALGAGVLLRGNLILFAIAAVTWLHFSRDGSRARHRRTALLVGTGLLMVLLPSVITGTIRSGRPAFVSSNGPYVFFVGNVHDSDGRSAGPSRYYYDVKASRPVEEIDLFSEALSDIAKHPTSWLHLQARKLAAFFSPEEIPNNLSYDMAKRTNPRLSVAFLEFFMLLPAALLGMVVSFERRGDLRLLYVFLASYTVATVAFFVLGRLRLPAALPLILFAGFGFEWLYQQVVAWRFLRASSVLGLIVLASVYLAPDSQAQLRATDYQMAAAAHYSLGENLERDDRLAEARHHFVRAIVLNPEHDRAVLRALALPQSEPQAPVGSRRTQAVALCEQARRAAEADDLANAQSVLGLALELDPELAMAHHYMSNIFALRDQPRRAQLHLERALELEPGNALFRHNLVALRRRVGVR